MAVRGRKLCHGRNDEGIRVLIGAPCIYVGFEPVMGSSFESISFRVIAFIPARPRLYSFNLAPGLCCTSMGVSLAIIRDAQHQEF